jgi:hypothetical protein
MVLLFYYYYYYLSCIIVTFTVTWCVSRPALRPTQTPVQWVQGVFPRDKSRPGRDADHPPPTSAEVKNE